MISIGAFLAACALAAAVLAARPPSIVGQRLARITRPRLLPARVHSLLVTPELARSGLGWSVTDLLRAKVIAAAGAATLAATVSLLTAASPVVTIAFAYGGFIAPSVYVERAARLRRAHAERALLSFVEWVEALVACGRPVETAVVSVAARGLGAATLDDALAKAARSYALGAPLFPALARESSEAGLAGLREIANDLERARDLGRGALAVLRDERDRLRASERARGLDAAGRVEGRLMLVLVLCYLPALMLLVVVPLFIGLLDGLFA